jgi:hypothetical protein
MAEVWGDANWGGIPLAKKFSSASSTAIQIAPSLPGACTAKTTYRPTLYQPT